MSRTRRDEIIALIHDTATDFLDYDRREDETLPLGAIQEAVAAGEITYAEIADLFRQELESGRHG